jgi:hypothetical protein
MTTDQKATSGRSRYFGACHCGAVQFEASLDLSQTLTCNCSYCSARGSILAFTPADGLAVLNGADGMREYRFNKHVIAHQFCSVCGVEPFARGTRPDGTAMVAINVRTLRDVDLDSLAPAAYDGRAA